jgi:hypothetical protein
MKGIQFTSDIQRTKGGVGWNTDPRDNNRLEEMGCTVGEVTPLSERSGLRLTAKRFGDGQMWDFFSVEGTCAACEREASLNIVNLCAECAREEQRTDIDRRQTRRSIEVAHVIAHVHGRKLAKAGA